MKIRFRLNRTITMSRALLIGVLLVFCFITSTVYAESKSTEEDCDALRQFTFSWQFVDQCNMQARGGTSRGADLTLDKEPHPGWQSLQEEGISDFERDRRAILAMAGPYRTSFDFLETVGYAPGFSPDPPYQSWGTEYVYVVEDRDDFISLQHIMVMQYEDEEGNVSEPFVQKHWRQDWSFQQRNILVYAGNGQWRHQKYSRDEAKGTWAQHVYQVDDSPRYAAIGSWEHRGNVSTWLSNETWRPLPRRESSLRKDYQVLVGTNRHTITPTGWVQEEENYKVVLNELGEPVGETPYLSKELGVARYERIRGFDFSAGDRYWRLTGDYWRDVREVWADIIESNKRFGLKDAVDGAPLFMPFFMQAEEIHQRQTYDSEEGREAIQQTLEKYLITE